MYYAIALLTGAVAFSSYAGELCPDARSQLEINSCIAKNLEESDKDMNAAYDHILTQAKSDKARQRLKNAQRAWIKFRDASCLFETGPREDSGTAWPSMYAGCLSKLTEKRTADLINYRHCSDSCVPH